MAKVEERPKLAPSQLIYGEVVYWITVASCIVCTVGPWIAMMNVDNNVANPYFLFKAIFDGKDAATVWQETAGGFPGGHFWFSNFSKGDGFTQFGLALGCGVAVPGLVAAALAYVAEKAYLYVALALWVGMLVTLSASGIVSGGH
jgi:hypothetical protein